MRRFRCEALNGPTGANLRLDKAEAAHLFRTLRAEPGEEVELIDGKGSVAMARVLPGKELELLSLRQETPPGRKLHLYLAPPRRQKMDQILRQAAELGIWRIVPTICRRSVSQPGADSVEGRWEDLLFEACKQSGNPFLPKLEAPTGFKAALDDASRSCGAMFYGSPEAEGAPQSLDCLKGVQNVGLFIGPEGGFAPEELEAMSLGSIKALRAGLWTLRVETAAICAAALLIRA